MESFFKRNQKKFLAIFSAGLMIAFALPGNKNNQGRADIVIGTVGGKSVKNHDVDEAREQWKLLRETVYRDPDPRTGQQVNLVQPFFGASAQELDAHPELFYLLWREAEDMGVTVNNEQLQHELVNTDTPGVAGDEGLAQRRVDAMRSMLMVANNADRVAKMAHVSRPQRDSYLAGQQEVSLNVVEFKAADYLDKVPKWDEREKAAKADQQYAKYKNAMPTTREARDPQSGDFRFGYLVPNRVRVQAIGVPKAKVRELAGSKIGEVEARKYYLQNQAQYPQFPTSRTSHTTLGVSPTEYVRAPLRSPQTRPATQPSIPKVFTQVSYDTASVISSPKHFEEYREEIFKKLTDERSDKLMRDILAEITMQLSGDYDGFKKGAPELPRTATSMPSDYLAKAPKTALGESYPSYEYLKKLALRTQERFGVLPVTYEDKGLRTAQELAENLGIGHASADLDFQSLFQADRTGQLFQMAYALAQVPTYATSFVQPFANELIEARARMLRLRILSLFEPSAPMHNRGGGEGAGDEATYVLRVAEAQPAHPADKNEAMDRLVADARLAAAYELGQQDAKKLLAEAQKSGLASAAKAAGRTVITTGLIGPRSSDVEHYKLPDAEAIQAFAQGAQQLLSKGTGNPDHPVGVVDLKPTATALAAEINEIRPPWTPDALPTRQVQIGSQADREMASSVRQAWLSYPQVVERLRYQPRDAQKPSRTPAGPAPAEDNPFK